jgi:hypothetical protein
MFRLVAFIVVYLAIGGFIAWAFDSTDTQLLLLILTWPKELWTMI